MSRTEALTALASAIRSNEIGIAEEWTQRHLGSQLLERFPNEFAATADPDAVVRSFTVPLLRLLRGWATRHERVYRDLYLAERRRYAPHLLGSEVLAEYFRTILPADERTLVDCVAEPQRESLRVWLSELHEPLVGVPEGEPVGMLFLGDCLLGEILPFVLGGCRDLGIAVDSRYLYFSARMGSELDTGGARRAIESGQIDLIAMSFLTYEGIPPYRALLQEAGALPASALDERAGAIVGLMGRFLESLREITDAPFLVHDASGLPLGRIRQRVPFVPALSGGARRAVSLLNQRIHALVEATPNCLLVEEARTVAERGLRKMSRALVPDAQRGAGFHPTQLGPVLGREYVECVSSYHALRKCKVLLVDFDNTLWKGVMADEEVEHHTDRQRLLRELKEAGILLVAVSKNSQENIRWSEMSLAPDDFVLLKISWDPKVGSIRSAAAELNLGIDSFVLIDDNPTERGMATGQIPGLVAMDPDEPATWRALRRLLELPNTQQTEEARGRTEMYRAQQDRERMMAAEVDYPSMMRDLGLEAEVRSATAKDLKRVAELVQRTNQFNTTTIRYSAGEIDDLARSDASEIYVGSLGDKFGDLGIVCVVIVRRSPDELELDSFIMSCRAMGFGMEHLALARVIALEGWRGSVVGRFRATDRNQPASGLFADNGFEALEGGVWVLAGGAPRPQEPDWFGGSAGVQSDGSSGG